MNASSKLRVALVGFTIVVSFLILYRGNVYAYQWGLEPGDILFATNFSEIVNEKGQLVSNQSWEHVAIYMGKGKVVESISEDWDDYSLPGARVLSLKKFLKSWKLVEAKRLISDPFTRQKRTRSPVVTREQVIDAAINYALRQVELGKPYDVKANKYDDSAFYCSELVWRAFLDIANIELDSNGGNVVSTDDVYKSKRLMPVPLITPEIDPSNEDLYGGR